MNAERLHAIAGALVADFDSTDVLALLQRLQTALTNQVNAPQEPSYQQQVVATLDEIYEAMRSSTTNDFPPIWRQTAEAIGAEGLLGEDLESSIRSIFERHQITLAVAASEISELAERLTELEERLRELDASLIFLNIGAEDLGPGEAEIGVLIPRPAVHEHLGELGEEFLKFEKYLSPFQELATGSRPPLKVATISSTDFGVFLDIDPKAAACVAIAVERVVAFYKQILEIRKLRQGLKEQKVPEKALQDVDGHANDVMAKGVREIVDDLLKDASARINDDRKNELRTELTISLNSIANRIDIGYNIDVRVAPDELVDEDPDGEEPSDDELVQAKRTIRRAARGLGFVNPEGAAILSLPESSEAVEKAAPKPRAPRKTKGDDD